MGMCQTNCQTRDSDPLFTVASLLYHPMGTHTLKSETGQQAWAPMRRTPAALLGAPPAAASPAIDVNGGVLFGSLAKSQPRKIGQKVPFPKRSFHQFRALPAPETRKKRPSKHVSRSKPLLDSRSPTLPCSPSLRLPKAAQQVV